MRMLSKKDKIWSWLLILLPAIILTASLIPGSMRMYDHELGKFVTCGLLNMPGGTVMDSVRLPLLFAVGYWVVLGIMYYRSQGLGTLKAIMIFGFLSAFLFSIALLLKNNSGSTALIKPMPYGLLPIASIAVAILAIVRLKQEEKIYDFD